jgi:phospholipase C
MSQTPDPSASLTRRRLLGSAAAVGGLAAASTVLPVNLRMAVASPPSRRGSLRDVKHVVMLMQENRSFDHYFGSLSGVRGFDDPLAARLPNGRSVFNQPDPASVPPGCCCPTG